MNLKMRMRRLQTSKKYASELLAVKIGRDFHGNIYAECLTDVRLDISVTVRAGSRSDLDCSAKQGPAAHSHKHCQHALLYSACCYRYRKQRGLYARQRMHCAKTDEPIVGRLV